MAKRRSAKKSSAKSSAGKASKKKPTKKRAKKSSKVKEHPLFDDEDEENSQIMGVPLRLAAQSRYLNYSLSVITSRALPDVRDGLKPVQRRILYTMNQQSLSHTAKHRKCAKVVGDVLSLIHI